MKDFDDPLDLLDDDGDGLVEMCLIEEEEEKRIKGGGNKNSGCCLIFFAVGLTGFLIKYFF